MTKDQYVRRLFTRIAPGYDVMNRLLSMGCDRKWRVLAAQRAARPGAKILDVGTGTGDMAFELARQSGSTTRIVGIDFCERMLERARRKAASNGFASQCRFSLADALNLPFSDESFDAVTCAFSLRNLMDISCALREFYRVLKSGGHIVVLDLGRPAFFPFRMVYYFYFFGMVPLLGMLNRGLLFSYAYLPRSLLTYPHQERLAKLMEETGFRSVTYQNLSGGIVAVHVGTK